MVTGKRQPGILVKRYKTQTAASQGGRTGDFDVCICVATDGFFFGSCPVWSTKPWTDVGSLRPEMGQANSCPMAAFKVTNMSLHYFCFNSGRKVCFAGRKLFPVSTWILQYRYNRAQGKKGSFSLLTTWLCLDILMTSSQNIVFLKIVLLNKM